MAKYFKPIAENRKARHDYHILETVQAGIMLTGAEVKALRSGEVNLRDSFARVEGSAIWLYNMYIKPYKFGRAENLDPHRQRKLLLNAREIARLSGKAGQKSHALIPLKIYFEGNWAKIDLGLGQAKKLFDKKETKKQRDLDREMERELTKRE